MPNGALFPFVDILRPLEYVWVIGVGKLLDKVWVSKHTGFSHSLFANTIAFKNFSERSSRPLLPFFP